MKQTWLGVLTLIMGVVVIACGGGDDGPEAASGTSTEVSGSGTSDDTAPLPDFGEEIDGAGAWDWTVTSLGQGTKPGIALSPDGDVLIAYLLERVGEAGFVNVASGRDGQFSIETLQRGYLYGPLDIAVGPGGAAVAFHNHDWEDGAIAVRGASGWDVQRIEHPGHDGWDGSLAFASDGALHVLSIDPAQFGAPEGIEYAVNGGNDWSVEAVGSGPQPYEWGTDLVVDDGGVVHAVYFDATASDLIYARRDAGGWELSVVYEAGDAGRFPSVALDAAGRPHVAFVQSDTPIAEEGRQALNVVYGVSDGDAWAFETVATLDSVVTGFEGARRTVALQVGVDGPVIAAIDESRVVLADRTDGTWATQTVVESAGDPLQVVGLALDANGAPHLTFATTTDNGPLDGEVWYLAPTAG